MDDPTRQIEPIIRSLTEGTREEQERTLNTYFLPDAYFIHPFCRVPSFAFGGIDSSTTASSKPTTTDPASWPLNSRYLVQLVYQWYKILSPKISIAIDSAALDESAGLLYVTIRQTFTLWIVPFNLWRANVKLLTVLELTALPPAASGGDAGNGRGKPRYLIRGQEDHYQVDQFLKFVSPFAPLWILWQLWATAMCVLGVAVLWPVTAISDARRRTALKNA